MQCVDFERRMNEVLDDRLDPHVDPMLISHARQCEGCQDLLDWNSAVVRAIPPAAPMSQPLANRFAISARRQWWTQPAVWGGLVAAAILAAIVVSLPETPDRSETPDTKDQIATDSTGTGPAPLDSIAIWAILDQIPVEENTRYVTVPIAGGIRPIRNSLGMAFEALRETLPPNKRPNHNPHPQTGLMVPTSLDA